MQTCGTYMKNKKSKNQQVLYVKMFGDFSLKYQGRSLIAKKKKETLKAVNVVTMNPNVKVGWNADKTEYAVPITEENIVILLLLTVPQDAIQMTANLKAPIIINADTRKGAQVVVENEEYEIKYRIYDILKGKKEA